MDESITRNTAELAAISGAIRPFPPNQPLLGPTGNETILIAEDEGALRTAARRILMKHGYTVLEAANGTEGVRIARRHSARIDLILADVMMPEMGGRRMVEIISAMRPSTHILFMSGYITDEVRRRELIIPGCAFIAKPFAVPDLLTRVRETIDQEQVLAVA